MVSRIYSIPLIIALFIGCSGARGVDCGMRLGGDPLAVYDLDGMWGGFGLVYYYFRFCFVCLVIDRTPAGHCLVWTHESEWPEVA
jgi:hypothetical protein